MFFQIEKLLTKPIVIARGRGIRTLKLLVRRHGKGSWRKLKADAVIVWNERRRIAEIHWYEAHGVGKRDFKIKAFLDE